MFSVSIQGNDGKDYELTKTEKSDLSGLSQGIEIGTKVEVTFDKDMNILSMVDREIKAVVSIRLDSEVGSRRFR